MSFASSESTVRTRFLKRFRPAARDPSGLRTFEVGLLGLGTVGQGVVTLLTREGPSIAARHGVRFAVKQVLVRDPGRCRAVAPPRGASVTSRPDRFLDGDFDLAVECLGGIEPASTLVSALLNRRVPVVTANKALLAERGDALMALAAEKRVPLRFEASVAAGIPVLGLVERALQSSDVKGIEAILNGTSNYIVTRLDEERCSLSDAVKDAQARGFAEADPSLDLSGRDAAQKLIILVRSLGGRLPADRVEVTGIEALHPEDCARARLFGYALKPLAAADLDGSGPRGFVGPALVPAGHPLAGVALSGNGVRFRGEPLGELFLSGPGAGGLPTAASILDDLIVAARTVRGDALWPDRGVPVAGAPETETTPGVSTASGLGATPTTPEGAPAEESMGAASTFADQASVEYMSDSGYGGAEAPFEPFRTPWLLNLSLGDRPTRIEDLLDVVAGDGLVFRELREVREASGPGVTGITAAATAHRIRRLESRLRAAGAVEAFRAYRVFSRHRRVAALGRTGS